MADPFLVRRLECLENLPRDSQGLFDRDGPAAQPLGQRLALDQLEDEVFDLLRLRELVDRGDGSVIQRRDSLRLTMEAGDAFRIAGMRLWQDLDGDLPIQPGIDRAIHLPHAAFARAGRRSRGIRAAHRGRVPRA